MLHSRTTTCSAVARPETSIVTQYQLTSSTATIYRGADKSLARPGTKQATMAEDFDVHISYSLS